MGLGIAAGVKCATKTPLVVTYLGTNGTGLSIGPARPDRIIVAIGFGENDAGGSMSSVTFGGVAGTILYSPTVSDSFGMAYKYVTTGTTVDVSIGQYGLVRTEFYMITGVKTGFHGGAAVSGAGSTLTCTIGSIPAQQCAAIQASRSRNSNSSWNAYSISGMANMNLDRGYNHAGGGNPSFWTSSGLSDLSGSDISTVHSGAGHSDGLGYCAVFK